MALSKRTEGDVGAREGEAQDLHQLGELCRSAFDEHRLSRGGLVHAALHPLAKADAALLRSYLSCTDYGVFVAPSTGDLVGFGIVGLLEGDGEVRVASVEAIYVVPNERRKGYGLSIVDLVVNWAGRNRCEGIDISALPGDRATKSFLEQAGFRARLLVMHHSIGSIEPKSDAS